MSLTPSCAPCDLGARALCTACCGRVRARQPSLWACLDNASVLRELATSTLRAPRRLFAATSYCALTAAPLHLPTDWPAAAARSATHLSQQPCPAILPSHRYVLLMEEKTSAPAGHACAPFSFWCCMCLYSHTRVLVFVSVRANTAK